MRKKLKTSDYFFGIGALMIIISFYVSNPYLEGHTPLSTTLTIISLVFIIIGTVYFIKKR